MPECKLKANNDGEPVFAAACESDVEVTFNAFNNQITAAICTLSAVRSIHYKVLLALQRHTIQIQTIKHVAEYN